MGIGKNMHKSFFQKIEFSKKLSNDESSQSKPNETNCNNSSIVCHNEVEVNVGFSGVRKHTSFRCDSKLWESFKKVCKNNGLSTCDILEKLILGFVVGYSTRVAQPTTIYVVVDAPRVVRRVRRRQLVFEDEVEVVNVDRCEHPGCSRLAEFEVYPSSRNAKPRVFLCKLHYEHAYARGLIRWARRISQCDNAPLLSADLRGNCCLGATASTFATARWVDGA